MFKASRRVFFGWLKRRKREGYAVSSLQNDPEALEHEDGCKE